MAPPTTLANGIVVTPGSSSGGVATGNSSLFDCPNANIVVNDGDPIPAGGTVEIFIDFVDHDGNFITSGFAGLAANVGNVEYQDTDGVRNRYLYTSPSNGPTTESTVNFTWGEPGNLCQYSAILEAYPESSGTTSDDPIGLQFNGVKFADIQNQGLTFPTGPLGSENNWSIVNNLTVRKIGPGLHSYAKRLAINADNTKYMLTSDTGQTQIIDVTDHSVIGDAGLNSESTLDQIDPDVVWGMQGSQYHKYTISTNTLTPISGVNGGSFIGNGEGRPSYGGGRVALNSGGLISVYDINVAGNSGTLLYTLTEAFDYATISSLGNYLITHDTGVLKVFNGATGAHLYDYHHILDHTDMGVDAEGRELIVFIGSGEPFWIDLETGKAYKWQFTPSAPWWIINGHVSGLASHQRPGWFYFTSVNRTDTSVANASSFAAKAQRKSVETPTNHNTAGAVPGANFTFGLFESEFADLFEWWGDSGASSVAFADQPHGAPSPDGTQMIITHNNGTSLDDYLVF